MMPVEDVFSIKGRGTVVTGRVDRGRIKVGEAGGDRRAAGKDQRLGLHGCGNVPQAAGRRHGWRQPGLAAARH